jgi:hypothetical protein
MALMSSTDKELADLLTTLGNLDQRFEAEMRARGFDPAQAENVALPSHLAALYAERERIRSEIEELTTGETND